MRRGTLSPAGQRRLRVGRKAIATTRVAMSIERCLPETKRVAQRRPRFHLPTIHYTFRKWHAIVASLIVLAGIGTSVFMNFQHQQAVAAERIRVAEAQKAAVKKETSRQACLADVTAKKKDQVGKATFDELYDGLCG